MAMVTQWLWWLSGYDDSVAMVTQLLVTQWLWWLSGYDDSVTMVTQ